MTANFYSSDFGRDILSVIPETYKGVFVVNNYLNTEHKDPDYFPVIIEWYDKTSVVGLKRAFPAVWNEEAKTYIKMTGCTFGGRYVCCSNSAGYDFFGVPAMLMDRIEE